MSLSKQSELQNGFALSIVYLESDFDKKKTETSLDIKILIIKREMNLFPNIKPFITHIYDNSNPVNNQEISMLIIVKLTI